MMAEWCGMRTLVVFPFFLLVGMLSGCMVPEYGSSLPYTRYVQPKPDVIMPTNAPSIMQQFRPLAPSGMDDAPASDHPGIDIVAKVGTPVLAAAPGRVVRSFFDPAFGNQIVIDHGADGRGLKARTVYKHLASRAVAQGDLVGRGQQIGTLGRTGALAAGIPHLHFEVHREKGPLRIAPRDPQLFWVNGVGRVTCFDPSVAVDETVFRTTYPVVCK